MSEHEGWYFTAPWDPVAVRRGDALGLRAVADYFADLLAPGLSNGTSDARWLSILSWCLTWSDIAWQKAGGRDLTRSDEQRERYAWLRPLELLWVARTLASGQNTGQLRGRRSIKRWLEGDGKLSNFAMSLDQFRRYRQVGTYGAYRVVLRTIPGLTTGDGWTPAETSRKLASLVNDSLPRVARLKQESFENGTQWGRWNKEKQVEYWTKHGWAQWQHSADRGFLPTSDDAIRKRLTEDERVLLEAALFGDDLVRRVTAKVLAKAKGARHADLCDALANSNALSKKLEPASLAPLPTFSRFADAAMHAMRGLWNEINHDGEKQAPTVEKLARSAELKVSFERLREAGSKWLDIPGRDTLRHEHEHIVTQLARAMHKAATPSEQVRMLSRHHYEHGGGRRWFREESGKLVPLVAHNGIAASDYRFRLRPLCLLAAQCGVAKMDNALNAMVQEAEDEEEKDAS